MPFFYILKHKNRPVSLELTGFKVKQYLIVFLLYTTILWIITSFQNAFKSTFYSMHFHFERLWTCTLFRNFANFLRIIHKIQTNITFYQIIIYYLAKRISNLFSKVEFNFKSSLTTFLLLSRIFKAFMSLLVGLWLVKPCLETNPEDK